MAIADEVAAELLSKVSMTEAGQPDVIAHHFAVVCERLGVTLDDAAVGRVLRYATNAIIRKERQVEDIQKKMDNLTEAFNQSVLRGGNARRCIGETQSNPGPDCRCDAGIGGQSISVRSRKSSWQMRL
jgi:hypothetical protein